MAREGRRTTLLQSFNYAFKALSTPSDISAICASSGHRRDCAHPQYLSQSEPAGVVAVVAAVTFVLAMELINSAVETVVVIGHDESIHGQRPPRILLPCCAGSRDQRLAVAYFAHDRSSWPTYLSIWWV
jgi:hypothetical protein